MVVGKAHLHMVYCPILPKWDSPWVDGWLSESGYPKETARLPLGWANCSPYSLVGELDAHTANIPMSSTIVWRPMKLFGFIIVLSFAIIRWKDCRIILKDRWGQWPCTVQTRTLATFGAVKWDQESCKGCHCFWPGKCLSGLSLL